MIYMNLKHISIYIMYYHGIDMKIYAFWEVSIFKNTWMVDLYQVGLV